MLNVLHSVLYTQLSPYYSTLYRLQTNKLECLTFNIACLSDYKSINYRWLNPTGDSTCRQLSALLGLFASDV